MEILRINTPRAEGGLGPIDIPLLSDLTHKMSKDYGVYLEDAGHTLRFGSVLVVIHKVGKLRYSNKSNHSCRVY